MSPLAAMAARDRHGIERVERYNLPKMKSILALDPAWTATEPSGVALLHQAKDRWKCVGLSPSYGQFVALAKGVPVDQTSMPSSVQRTLCWRAER
jgi:hypothetical protein